MSKPRTEPYTLPKYTRQLSVSGSQPDEITASVSCPVCGAPAGFRCASPKGFAMMNHALRGRLKTTGS